ncbi:hypothetical protein QBC44DRAFT_316871 [Cladorrhinum sp. PSN332]|nr:hypothetical protein QBC44DRAFT_316871 [Cladorrhinum sp. PSN332]
MDGHHSWPPQSLLSFPLMTRLLHLAVLLCLFSHSLHQSSHHDEKTHQEKSLHILVCQVFFSSSFFFTRYFVLS